MIDQTLQQKIDAILLRLSAPLSAEEINDGWTRDSKTTIKALFEDLRDKIRSGAQLPPLSIARGLDHWGVSRGDIREQATAISNQLRAWKRSADR